MYWATTRSGGNCSNRPSASRLEARLARTADALFALYEYGALHGGVRLRRRKGDALLPVSWSMRGDPDFWSFVNASFRQLVPVQVVIGPPAGLAHEPGRGAVQLTLVECERDGRTLYARAGEDDVKVLDRAEVSAIVLPATATRAIDSSARPTATGTRAAPAASPSGSTTCPRPSGGGSKCTRRSGWRSCTR